MNRCDALIYLAYLSTAYLLASIIYLICTRNIGTPVKDEMKKNPKIMKLKKLSSNKRRHIFIAALLLTIIILFIFKPFSNCEIVKKNN